MNALLTGANGTVGQALAAHLRDQDATVTPWNRHATPPLDLDAQAWLFDAVQPDAVFHLAIAAQPTGRENEGHLVNVAWPEAIARLCAERGIALVFTSTAMVFEDGPSGPFHPDTAPTAQGGYGGQKREAENVVHAANPDARIVRLGWQIAPTLGKDAASKSQHNVAGGNHMGAHLAARAARGEVVGASTRWYPACSFLPDTAAALVAALDVPPGTYMADANGTQTADQETGVSFYDLVCALRDHYGTDWHVEPNEDFVFDQRMIDPRLPVQSLATRLPELIT
ncbi:MAG: sugar nucleotide-binding protein [Bacteroidota bacterium]